MPHGHGEGYPKNNYYKKVVCTIHHFDHNKFDDKEFKDLDEYVDVYHIITKKSEKFLSEITNKKYFYSPFWIDSKNFLYQE